ncbi:putative cyclic nucleotide-gated ion channel 8 isoform X3 [Castanea sativa]|uniref:putative cyclic nucleotide-gated ion channel 8 isoform X3 n=1 Tax=Castanea sativa TaxID=21020 RepID=UPI003F651423
MFDCGYKSQYIGGQTEKFVRLDDLDSTLSMPSGAVGKKRAIFNLEGLNLTGHAKKNSSKSFRYGMKVGSDGLKTIGRSLRSGVTRAVFPEDLKVSEKKIFDPQDKSLLLWNRLFVISCILAVSIDPLFFYLPVFNHASNCLGMDTKLAVTTTTLRTILDSFYLIRMALQFRTAYIAPSSRVFGRGELVIDPTQIAKRYLQRYFLVDLLSVLPLPQIVVWKFLQRSKGSEVLATKQALLHIVLFQYVPRFARFFPLNAELKKTAGVFAESALVGAAYYLLWYILSSHITGAFWYLFAVERNDTCWRQACKDSGKCDINYLYCGNKHMEGYSNWEKIRLETSTYPGEVLFSILIAISGLLLFALLIGNMQTYLQSLTVRVEEMRIKRRDSEQWMHHRLLPQDLRERVRRYDQYKWLETRGVDEESLVQSLPKDLRRDIKRHLCLNLVRRVPLFANMDERLLDAICERLKPSLYTERTYIVREGDPVDEMLFIIRGRLESVTTDGGRSGFFNRGLLKEGDFCGEELLTWALDPKAGSNLPSSTRTVKALTEVEAFALEAEELKFVASQFRRLHSRQVQHTFRFYSQQWRTWAACFIQAAWRRYLKRRAAERHRQEEAEEEEEEEALHYGKEYDDVRALVSRSDSTSRLGATILASRFAANALRGHRLRNPSAGGLVKLQKPPEPDFTNYDSEK